jgi:hypothetical protein
LADVERLELREVHGRQRWGREIGTGKGGVWEQQDYSKYGSRSARTV